VHCARSEADASNPGVALGLDEQLALAFSMAAGAASVATYGTAQVRREDVEDLFRTWCQADNRAG
jgi:hypothetical protein